MAITYSINVLLVEDSETDARIVTGLLTDTEPGAFQVTRVRRLDEARAALNKEPRPEVVLLDLGLPDAEGVTALREVHTAAPEVPIVVLSATSSGEAVYDAIQLGAQDYLVKGTVDGRTLCRALRYALVRHAAHLDLARREKLARYAIETAGDGIVLTNEVGCIMSWNRAAERLFGLTQEEALGRMFFPLIAERFRPDMKAAEASVKLAIGSAGAMKTFPLVGCWRTGEGFVIEITLTHSNYDGRGVWCALIRDIHDRVRVEHSLLESELAFRTMATAAPVGILHLNEVGRILYANPRWCEFSGYTAAEAVGEPWTLAVHPEEWSRLTHAWAEAERNTTPFVQEYRYRTRQGKEHWVNGRATTVRNSLKNATGYVLLMADITERKRSDRERECIVHELEAALEQTKLMSGLLHICAQCKKIMNDAGEWQLLEAYVRAHLQATFSHGLCPDCGQDFLSQASK